ncbi:MAG: hypothetical protein HOV81_04520 [Kofleriaceae bacterium]|nr:hypothetical protein [Kofleriaceae bacterium]
MKSGFLLAALALASCQTVDLDINDTARNSPPLADAGLGSTYAIMTPVMLDASSSVDPDGSIVSYHWMTVTKPALSRALINPPNAAVASIILDAPGTYEFEVTVADDEGATAKSTVTFHAEAIGLTVDAGVDAALPMTSNVQLQGSANVDPGVQLTTTWTFVSKPTGSMATLSSASSLAPTFTADREGTYVVRLTAVSPFESRSDDVSISATVDRQALPYLLVDAEYSRALDRFVIASDLPARLHIHDPATANEVAVDLAQSPLRVSLSPDGLRAAIANANQSVTIVNLQTATVTGTYAVPISLAYVTFGADNRVHCFDAGPNFNWIYTIDLATSSVTPSTGRQIYHDTHARLHPSSLVMYTLEGLGSHNLYRFDVSGSPVTFTRKTTDTTHDMGADLWFTRDGGTIITPSGNLFYASSDSTVDMTFRAKLGLGGYLWADHSEVAQRIAVTRVQYNTSFNPSDYFLELFDDQTLTLVSSRRIPDTPANNMFYLSVGRFVAYRSDGSKLYVIAKSGPMNGVVHALYPFDP